MNLIKRAAGSVQLAPLVAAISMLLGVSLAVTGVYLLAGLGWTFIAGSVPPIIFSVVVARGLLSAE